MSDSARALEEVFAYVDKLVEQGKSRHDALSHASFRYGVERFKLATLLNDRDAGYIGDTGSTEFGVISTPSTASGPVEHAAPDTFPEEWV